MPVVKLLDVSGDGQARGEAHGEALRAEVVAGIERWRDEMAANQPLTADAFIEHIHHTTQFLQTVTRCAPDLLAEVRGIAAGANLDFDTVFAFQLLDECWWLAAQPSQESELRESCSSLAIHDVGGSALAAQTMDLPRHYDGGQVLLRFRDPTTGIRQLVFTVAGLVGLNGLNDKWLAVCVNTLSELACSRRGLPVAFVVRSLLNRPDLASAVEFLESTQHASGQNYLLTSPAGIVDIEAGAESIFHYPANGIADCVYHTNHVLAGPLADSRARALDESTIAGPSSARRLEAMTRFFDRHPQPDLDTIKSLLASADGPICVPRDSGHGFTFGASIMSLGAKPLLHVTHGPATTSSFVQYTI